MPRRPHPLVALAALATAVPLLVLTPSASAATVAKPYDFNGDGFPELVVGAPDLQVGSVQGAGGISVLPASKRGVSTAGVVLTQATAGVPGDPAEGRGFGSAFASADFDHDGYADLAVGAPYAGEGGGRVVVLHGSASGLVTSRSYAVARAGTPEDDGFGASLVAADLDGDGFADLAVGAPSLYGVDVPDEDYPAGGTVTVLQGARATFTTARSTVLEGEVAGYTYDRSFGSALAAGDVDGDARPDLVVASRGVPFDDGQGHGGGLSVCTSGSGGPSTCRQVGFGHVTGSDALAVGNVRGDERDEIVVGQPQRGSEGDDAGLVHTLSLSGTGSSLKVKDSELTQATKGVPGSNERRDEFGGAVALGDLDRDGYADLVVGSPGETIGSREGAGRVTVVYGGKKGYRTSGNKAYDQNTKSVPGTAEQDDRFGDALTLVDHDADGHLDLTAGAPGENDGAGGVTTLDGSGKGFTAKGSKTFGLGALGYPTLDGAAFGASLGR